MKTKTITAFLVLSVVLFAVWYAAADDREEKNEAKVKLVHADVGNETVDDEVNETDDLDEIEKSKDTDDVNDSEDTEGDEDKNDEIEDLVDGLNETDDDFDSVNETEDDDINETEDLDEIHNNTEGIKVNETRGEDGDELNETDDKEDRINETEEFDDDENEEDDSDDLENETAPFQSSHGAEMRLMQLEKAIEKNILWGEYIISAIEDKNESIDTMNLKSILAELIALKDEVSAMNVSNETNTSAAAQAFVDIKKEARNLTKEFRDEVKTLIKAGDIQGLKKKLGERYKNWETNQTEKIKKKVCEYNADKIERIFEAANVSDSELIERIRNCSADKEEIADALDGINLSRGQQNQLKSSLKETKVKTKVFARAITDKVKYKQLEREQERLGNRLEHAYDMNLSADIVDRIQNRMNLSNHTMERIQNRTQKRISYVQNWTDKKIAHWENLEGRILNLSERQIGKIDDRLDDENVTDKQKENLEKQKEHIENRTDKLQEDIENKINKTEEHSEKVIDKLEKIGNGKNGGQEND
jgi:hypothetical protein